jgi:TetR/AcrR family transcriptional regulator of autoinduction and epiphytic fitness
MGSHREGRSRHTGSHRQAGVGRRATLDPMGTVDPEVTDRRVLRGMRNREAVVEAVIALIEEGDLNPPAAAIAERAGVSLRSIYHHFTDLDDLSRAVADRMFSSVAELWTPNPTDGPLDPRIKAFVRQRTTLVERSMPMYRASLLAAPNSPPVAERLDFIAEFFRDVAVETFATELRDAPSWKLEAIDSLASLDGWVRLRVNQRLSVRKAGQVLSSAMLAILAAD